VRSQTWTITGAAVVAAGVLLLGMAYATSGVVHAVPAECFQTPESFGSSPGSDVAMAGIVAEADSVAPQCTETPTPQRKLKTHTPTPTSTETPKTNTPVPPTATPTNTPKAASEAVTVKPPNTGSGGSAAGDMTVWLLALGGAAVALGGGTVFVGLRRR
jgi:hypothetical protein